MPDRVGAQQPVSGLVGTVLTLPGPTAAELLAEPFDVVWIDMEHAPLGPLDMQEMVIGAQAAGARAFVRLAPLEEGLIAQALDAGADGVVVADVRSAATVAGVRARMLHPPHGTRGWGPRRLALRGRSGARAARAPSLWIQVEHPDGIDAAPAMAAVSGVEAVVIGTADLSHALGTPLDVNSAEMCSAIASVREAAIVAGARLGLAGAVDTVSAASLADVSILIHGTDARLCAAAVDSASQRLRALMERTAVRG